MISTHKEKPAMKITGFAFMVVIYVSIRKPWTHQKKNPGLTHLIMGKYIDFSRENISFIKNQDTIP